MIRDPEETIAAIATPKGFGARLIIRISGPETWQAVHRVITICDNDLPVVPAEPVIRAASLRLRQLHGTVPCELYYWPPGRSYTGQAVAEIHMWCCHPLAEAVLTELQVRPAEPGEFTLRAFLSGRLDLTQAEAVLGVIDAVDPEELRHALDQLAGGLGTPLQKLREGLLDLLVELELGFDFVEEDLPFLSRDVLWQRLSQARQSVTEIIERAFKRRTADELPMVVLLGRPNVGKSTLFNALLGGTRAIVSPVPGTTRDYLTAVCEHGGVKFQLVDTAGLWQLVQSVSSQMPMGEESNENAARYHSFQGSNSIVDQAAQAKARALIEKADIRLFCVDVSRPLQSDEQTWLEHLDPASIVVLTKIDLEPDEATIRSLPDCLRVSAQTGVGVNELKDLIIARLIEHHQSTADIVTATAVRCRSALLRAHEALTEAEALARSNSPEETIASALRAAIDEFEIILGTVYTEDVLDRIFSRFCIGK